MAPYVFRRVLAFFLVLVAVSFAVFAALSEVPGDAAETLAGESASAEQLATIRREMGIDAPLPVRYTQFVVGAITRADLGKSFISGRRVSDLVAERFPATAILAFSALTLAITAGTTVGALAARRPGGRFDFFVMGASTLGLAVPTYWMAMLLVMVFALNLKWLPVAGSGEIGHLILPTVTLALPTTAVVARLVRSSLLEVAGADYLRTARGKGLDPFHVFRDHALANSLVPVITVLGLHLGHLLGGAFVVETLFAWPGLGRLTVQAIFDRDSPVVLGAAILVAALNVTINLAIDIAHAFLDPRLGRHAI